MNKIKSRLKQIHLSELLNKIIKNNKFPYFVIFCFSFLILFPSLIHGVFHLGEDEAFHLTAIEQVAKGLPFSIFEKITPGIANNLGYGLGIFYPAFPHIMGGLILKGISIFGFGSAAAITLLNLLIFFTAGMTMYWLGKTVFNDNIKGLICSLFYITYSYFFVDVIVRCALNESFMFIFMPLVFLGLYNLLVLNNTKKFYIFFIVGYIGLMYSHLVMSVYFTLFLLVFLLFYIKEVFTKKNFICLCIAALIILIFSSSYIVLMIEHNLFGDYVVFTENSKWVIDKIWRMPFIGFFSEYNYAAITDDGLLCSNLNFIVTIFCIITLICLIRNKVDANLKKFLMAIFVFGILGILLNTFISIWLYVPSLLLSIQFVWRLSLFVGFAAALIATEGFGFYLTMFKKKYVNIAFIIILAFLASFVMQTNNKTVYREQLALEKDPFKVVPREYFTTDAYRKYFDYVKNRDNNEIVVVNGNAETKIIKNEVPYMKFEVNDAKGKVNVEIPRLYYLGYTITDKNNNKIDYSYDKYGFITLDVKEGIYEVKYTGTLAHKIACILKIILILVLSIYLIFIIKKRRNEGV